MPKKVKTVTVADGTVTIFDCVSVAPWEPMSSPMVVVGSTFLLLEGTWRDYVKCLVMGPGHIQKIAASHLFIAPRIPTEELLTHSNAFVRRTIQKLAKRHPHLV